MPKESLTSSSVYGALKKKKRILGEAGEKHQVNMSIKPVTCRAIIKLNLGSKFGLNKLSRSQFSYPF